MMMMMMRNTGTLFHFFTWVAILLQHKCCCYSEGAPSAACLTLFPTGHGAEKSTSESPFAVKSTSETYSPGQSITVTLYSTMNGTYFKGFLVTAHRTEGNTEEFVGTFTVSDNTSKTVDCFGQQKVMATHSTSDNRSNIDVEWSAPNPHVGTVQFIATFVQEKDIFWYKINQTIQSESDEEPTSPADFLPKELPMPSALTTMPNWTECGKSIGCFLVPKSPIRSCSGTDCQAAMSYRKDGDLYTFELAAQGEDSYVAVGFSEDVKMGIDQTILCSAIPGYQSVQLGYNLQYENERQYTIGLSDLAVKQQDGYVYCKFTRQASISSYADHYNASSMKVYDLNSTQYYILLAWGPIFIGTDVIQKHLSKPAISASKTDLNQLIQISRTVEINNSTITKRPTTRGPSRPGGVTTIASRTGVVTTGSSTTEGVDNTPAGKGELGSSAGRLTANYMMLFLISCFYIGRMSTLIVDSEFIWLDVRKSCLTEE